MIFTLGTGEESIFPLFTFHFFLENPPSRLEIAGSTGSDPHT